MTDTEKLHVEKKAYIHVGYRDYKYTMHHHVVS